MKNEQYGIGDYSTSPAGQGCLWVAALGVIGVLAFAYVGSYTGMPQEPLDRMENGIEGVTRPTNNDDSGTTRPHYKRRRHRAAEQYTE